MDQPVSVAAGLIFRKGKLLITQRPAGSHLQGLWEFPGGKCESNETLPECLQREIFEELGVAVNVRGCLETLEHAYPEKTVRLSFFRCELAVGEPEGMEGQAIAWISPEQLGDYSFPEADAKLLQKLHDNEDWWAGK
jgi:mutator protein MutT